MTAVRKHYRALELKGDRRSASGRKPRYRCRCSNKRCQHRETFRGLPWTHRRPPTCPNCGSKKWRVDWYRTLHETTRRVCHCGGRHFPHNRNSCEPAKHKRDGM